MGHTRAANGALTATATPPQTVSDLQAAYDRIEEIGGLLTGTAADRASLTSSEARNGWFFAESDTGRIFWRRNGEWKRVVPGGGGFFVGNTSEQGSNGAVSDGVVTVNHGLGFTPSSVVATDRNGGGVPALRKILVSAVNSTQIQFLVYSYRVVQNGSNWELQAQLLPNNPVEFNWVAFQ